MTHRKKGGIEDSAGMRRLQDHLDAEISADMKQRLETQLDRFRQDLAAHPYVQSAPEGNAFSRWTELLRRRMWGRALLMGATGLVGACILLAILFFNQPPTWAEVERQFGTIPFCTVSVYLRDNPHDRPLFAQYWFGPNGRARAHVEDLVVFLGKDIPTRTFDIKSRTKSHPIGPIKGVLRSLQKAMQAGTPTLRSIIQAMTGEEMADTTDLVISDPQVARDQMVFDSVSREGLWWLRAWALKESRVPTRILKWHRKNGRYVDLHFTYSTAQKPDFFDPGAFAARMLDPDMAPHRLNQMFHQEQTISLFPSHSGRTRLLDEKDNS